MVEIEEIQATPSPSQERLLDAEEIEKAAASVSRPTARMQLISLAKKLRKEAAALKVVEASHEKAGEPLQTAASPAASPAVAPATPSSPAKSPAESPKPASAPPPIASSAVKYASIDRFSFDAGGYNDRFVTLYIPLPGVGDISKDLVTCDFTKQSFDLVVKDFKGISYRLFKDNLEKDIVSEKSKFIVKADKIVIKLAKVKGEYGSYDFWSKLTDPNRKEKSKKSSNPAASINEMMKEMYDSGDDNMRKMIGETMLKQREGRLDDLKSRDMGLGDLEGGI